MHCEVVVAREGQMWHIEKLAGTMWCCLGDSVAIHCEVDGLERGCYGEGQIGVASGDGNVS